MGIKPATVIVDAKCPRGHSQKIAIDIDDRKPDTGRTVPLHLMCSTCRASLAVMVDDRMIPGTARPG
jgi:hypothetical protein